MKRSTTLFFILLQAMAYSASAQWYQVWADEFNAPAGTGVDPTQWTYEIGCVCPNFETVCYTNSPVNARHNGNGQFVIEAQSGGGTCGQSYTSARLKTEGKFTNLYGRYEASIQLPQAQGTWPAFWLLGEDIATVGWPACGEIDIMETIWSDIGRNHGSAHGPGYNGATPITGTYALPAPSILSDTFHTYALEWDTTEIRYYFDGNLFYSFTPADLGGNPWVFDTPMFIILNVAVGGLWPGPAAPAPYPDSMLVDYIRVYQQSHRIVVDGPDQVCPGAEGIVYSIPNDPDLTYTWSVPPGVTIQSGQGTHEITVDWGNFPGTVSVNFTDGGSVTGSPSVNVNLATNTIRNPGFEDAFNEWNTVGAATFNINTTDFASGFQSGEVIVTTGGTGNAWDVQLTQPEIRLDTGHNYDLTFWARALNNNRNIRVNFINNGADIYPPPAGWFNWAIYAGQNFTLTNAWQPYTFSFNSPVTDPHALFTIDLNFDSDTYRFDDFQFACDWSYLLPVEWEFFSADTIGRSTLLRWKTGSNPGNQGFEVQRSVNGLDFSPLGRSLLPPTITDQFHSFQDSLPLPGLNYYRIAQFDADGSVHYSETRVVNHKAATRIYRVDLEGISFSIGQQFSHAEIVDLSGRTILHKSLSSETASHFIAFPPLVPGIYLLRLRGDQNQTTRKFRLQY